MLPLRLFADRQFTGANLATLAVYGALGGSGLFLVLQLQTVLGYDATAAGAALLPSIALITLLSPRMGALATRIGPRLPMTVGPLIVAAGTLWLAGVDGSAPYVVEILPGSLLQGLGHGHDGRPADRDRAGRRPGRAGRDRQRREQRRRAGRAAAGRRRAAGGGRACPATTTPTRPRSPAGFRTGA